MKANPEKDEQNDEDNEERSIRSAYNCCTFREVVKVFKIGFRKDFDVVFFLSIVFFCTIDRHRLNRRQISLLCLRRGSVRPNAHASRLIANGFTRLIAGAELLSRLLTMVGVGTSRAAMGGRYLSLSPRMDSLHSNLHLIIESRRRSRHVRFRGRTMKRVRVRVRRHAAFFYTLRGKSSRAGRLGKRELRRSLLVDRGRSRCNGAAVYRK